MFDASLRGWRPMTRTLTYATPLILTGLAAAIAFRMRVYNIGAEGQLFAGAIAGSWVALILPEGTPKPLMLLAMLLGGVAAGVIWAGLAAVPKAFLGTDEIITTLMLNFVALGLMNYLIFGSRTFWRDPARPVPQGLKIPAAAELPTLSGRLHIGIIVAVAVAVVLWLVLRTTTWGFRVRVIGESHRVARYAGIAVPAATLVVMSISGGLAGLAGAIEVSGVTKSLQPRALAIELGYTGIVIAAVARSNPLGVVPVAVFLAAVATSGGTLQSLGIPVEVAVMLQGMIFLAVTAGEFFVTNRLTIIRATMPEPVNAAPTAAPMTSAEATR
jgi:simple sugar transport system permease protein